MSGSEENEVSILKRQISALQKENEDLKNENQRLKRDNQSTDIIKCMEQIHDDLRTRYVRLDELVHNPGLEHIALHIFKYLDPKSLGQCRAVSKGWKSLIDNDKFWWMQILDGKMIIYNNLIQGFGHDFRWTNVYMCPAHEPSDQFEFFFNFKDTFVHIKENETLENLRRFGKFVLDFYCWIREHGNIKFGVPDPESPETLSLFAADSNRLAILEYLTSLPAMSDIN